MLMLKSTHEAIVAKKDAESKQLVDKLRKELEGSKQREHELWRTYCGCDKEASDLRTRLAVFTAPRKRGLGGRFVSSKGGVA